MRSEASQLLTRMAELFHRWQVQKTIDEKKYAEEFSDLLTEASHLAHTVTGHETQDDLLRSLTRQAQNEDAIRLDQCFRGMVLKTAKQVLDQRSPTGSSFSFLFHAPVVVDTRYGKWHTHSIEEQQSKRQVVAGMLRGTPQRVRAQSIYGCKKNPCEWHPNSQRHLVWNEEQQGLTYEE